MSGEDIYNFSEWVLQPDQPGIIRIYRKDGSFYEGQFVQGKPEGSGRNFSMNTNSHPIRDRFFSCGFDTETKKYVVFKVYAGEWKDGNMHGKGIIHVIGCHIPKEDTVPSICAIGSLDKLNHDWITQSVKYEGEFKQGNISGIGKMTICNRSKGILCEGEWIKGYLQGEGKITYGLPICHGKIWDFKYDYIYEGQFHLHNLHGHGIKKYYNGYYHKGNWKNGNPDGKGEKLVKGLVCYYGNWKNGKLHGKGQISFLDEGRFDTYWSYGMPMKGVDINTFENGNSYVGEWKKGFPSGRGTMIYLDIGEYEGEFRKGRPYGEGTMIYKNGEKYVGDWIDGKRHGKGTMINDLGEESGEWRNDQLFTGKGEVEFPDGDLYTGTLLKGQPHGNGDITFANGGCYSGEWNLGFPHGTGIKTFPNGDKYKGEFEKGHPHGKGTMTYKAIKWNSETYTGEWMKGVRHGEGEGTKTFVKDKKHCGEFYEGGWENDLHHGHGKMMYSSGNVYDGEWIDGRKCGEGKMIYSNGDEYEGMWDDKQNGEGTFKYVDGRTYEGAWKNGKKGGPGKLTLSDGSVIEGIFDDKNVWNLKKLENGSLVPCQDYRDSYRCPICRNLLLFSTIVTTKCKHHFCSDCLDTWKKQVPNCPICRENLF